MKIHESCNQGREAAWLSGQYTSLLATQAIIISRLMSGNYEDAMEMNTANDAHDPPRKPAATELGAFHADNVRGFPEVLRELGGNPQILLTQCGIDPAIFSLDPDDRRKLIPFNVGARLLALAAKETGCPHFGLYLGQRLESTMLGPVSLLMQHSPTVQVALQNLLRFLHLRVEGAAINISSRGGIARFTFNFGIPGMYGSDQIQDLAMANFVGFMRVACGSHWTPTTVYLSHPAPADYSPYRELFGAAVRFNKDTNAMLFPESCLSQPIDSADPTISQVIKRYVVEVDEQHLGDIVGQLRRTLPTLLLTGNCTVNRVADLFSMHRRTLHRHLAAEGLTFEQVLDMTRREIADNVLAHSDMPLSQLSSMLGYSDPSTFSRAFKRWKGMTATEWREYWHRKAMHAESK